MIVVILLNEREGKSVRGDVSHLGRDEEISAFLD